MARRKKKCLSQGRPYDNPHYKDILHEVQKKEIDGVRRLDRQEVKAKYGKDFLDSMDHWT